MRRIYRIWIDYKASEILFFVNGGDLRVYALNDKREKTLSKLPGFYRGSGLLGITATVIPQRKE